MADKELNIAQLKRLPAKQAGSLKVAEFFQSKKAIIAQALPKHMSSERLLRTAMTALQTTPALLDCSLESLFGAIIKCSILGLEPNTPAGHVYLVPFKNKRKGVTEVQVFPGYRGLIELAYRSGKIDSIVARLVYEGEPFTVEYGTEDRIIHSPSRHHGDEIIAVYAIAKIKNAAPQFIWMWKEEVDSIMLRYSQSKGEYGPWKDEPGEMMKKTAIRRLCKNLPMSIELAMANELQAKVEAEEPQDMAAVLTGDFSVVDDSFSVTEEGTITANEAPQAS